MKKIFTAFIGIAIALSSFGQVSNSFLPLVSGGGQTYQGNVGGRQVWTGKTLTYTLNLPNGAMTGYYDTIGSKDTCRGLLINANAKNKALPGTLKKPNVLTDSICLFGNWKSGSFQINLTKVSGTVADTAWLQVSDDGTNWIASGQDTAYFTNVTYTQTYIWEVPGRQRATNSTAPTIVQDYYNATPGVMPYQFYRIYVSGMSTTQAALVKCMFLKRQGP